MCRNISHPEPGHVGPDRMVTGSFDWGLRSGGVEEETVALMDFGLTGLGCSTDSVVRTMMPKKGDL